MVRGGPKFLLIGGRPSGFNIKPGTAMLSDHIDYFRQRAAQELIIADQCTNPMTATIHRRMAEEYSRRVNETEATLRIVVDR